MRGPAGEFLTSELAFALGHAATSICESPAPQVLVVRDTRVSGEMLESALAAGIAAAGGQALLGGILPTPAASLLVRRHGFDLAVVISASHNPYRDNGIKFFGASGHKLGDAAEAEVERLVAAGRPQADVDPPGRVRPLTGALDDYLRELGTHFDLSLEGKRVLLDCANGATYRAAPLIFERLGATVECVAVEPDGTNINENCGSTHIDLLAELVKQGSYDAAFAFDGDGDRVLACDPDGKVIDGDEIIAAIALSLKRRQKLNGGVAVTVMTNYGFHSAMKEAQIDVATTAVGDRYVVEELVERAWSIGGEQSGHVIDMRLTPSGDGIASALLLLDFARRCAAGGRRRDEEAAAEADQRSRARSRRAAGGRGGLAGGRGRLGRARRFRPCVAARVRDRAVDSRDGRGAQRRAVRADRRAVGRAGRAFARLCFLETRGLPVEGTSSWVRGPGFCGICAGTMGCVEEPPRAAFFGLNAGRATRIERER